MTRALPWLSICWFLASVTPLTCEVFSNKALTHKPALSESAPEPRRDLQNTHHKLVLKQARLAAETYSSSKSHGLAIDPKAKGLNGLAGGDPRRLIRRRCRQTRGPWCGQFDRQTPEPPKPAPRGNKECRNSCNGVGNCDYDTGMCHCPAGWTGEDCGKPEKRPCTHRHRSGNETEVQSHIGPDGRDTDWQEPGWIASRCSGICDDDLAMCWCDGKYKRIPASPGSPPGTPPIQRGRPLSEWCGKVQSDKDGKRTDWGNVPYSKIYGEHGWCNADKPQGHGRCDTCQLDGLAGDTCDIITESFCVNQCSGHGECNLGFCKCHPGWYGTDCSRKKAGESMEADDIEAGKRPWLKQLGLGQLPPGAQDPPKEPTRKRPLIYVYDVPPPYTTRMLQYRLVWKSCIWRRFEDNNATQLFDWLYGVETYIHEMLLTSPHRTFDPDEADFFYVPIYVTCYFWPIIGWADTPWWYAPRGMPRPMHGANMMLELKTWLETTFPYWKRRGGRDHIWLTAADEGACWMPTEVYNNSIILTHWGRLDTEHRSNTAFYRDNYNDAYKDDTYQLQDWRNIIEGHACYNPNKDLVIPSLKLPEHYAHSPLMGGEPMVRDILCYFRGDMGERRDPQYSRRIRQMLHRMAKQNKWGETYRIHIGTNAEVHGVYSRHLARSIFCLVLPGDGWSARAEDAILHGCIPVVIMDRVHAVFESILDWDLFSVRLPESKLSSLPHVLLSYTEEQIIRMQRRLAQVWHRFAYMSGKPLQDGADAMRHRNKEEFPPQDSKVPKDYPFQRVHSFPVQDDAFSTIIQWLYSKIPQTRGN